MTVSEGMGSTGIGAVASQGIRAGLFRVTFQNGGDKPANGALATVAVSENVSLSSASAQGQQMESIDLTEFDGWGGKHSWRISNFPPGQPETAHFVFTALDERPIRIQLAIRHEDSEPSDAEFEVVLRLRTVPIVVPAASN